MPMPYAPLRLTRSEFHRTQYFLVLPEGVTVEKVMSPEFWVHTKRQLRLHDLFELVAEDGSFDALIRVTSINQVTGDIRWRVLHHWIGSQAKGEEVKAPPADARFVVKSRGFGKFAVIERETGVAIADGISKAEANETAARAEQGEMQAA